ncbi:pyridoxal phosphate-dependent transferase [Aspergillus leporis]|uniref:Ornithine aminotransferase n=1 Tax=Aspergillus leporis TaxID=41062 RepID=A0A5N5WPC0_9EURO|nr:pyridoxal phosphate-dependent transferase [Aspergillus leporis]
MESNNGNKPALRLSPRVKELLGLESRVTIGGFDPMPYFSRKDVDGKRYIDFIGMFSAVNTGHCHPHIQKIVIEQLKKVTLVNLSSHNSTFGPFAQRLCTRFGYDRVAAMTSGTEAADTACKIARCWGINQKCIPTEECIVLGVGGCYHGLASGVWGLMDSNILRTTKHGLDSKIQMNTNPRTGELLEYLDLERMRSCLQEHKDRVAAVIIECIHGYSRDENEEIRYARGVYELCKSMNILFIADEVRQGAGKTGMFFSFQHLGDDVKPDTVIMGKSITGGFYPQSFIMGVDTVMASVGPYEIASTYSFTPLAIAAANATIDVIDRENLIQRGVHIGDLWRKTVESWNHPLVDYVAQVGADSNLILREVEPSRVASLVFAMNLPEVLLLEGSAILKSCLDDINKYGSIEGEVIRYKAV